MRAVGSGYAAPVAIGLFLEIVKLLYHAMVVSVEFLIPLYRTEIGGGEQGG